MSRFVIVVVMFIFDMGVESSIAKVRFVALVTLEVSLILAVSLPSGSFFFFLLLESGILFGLLHIISYNKNML